MASYSWSVEDLQGLALGSLQLVYNADGADTLSFELTADKYAKLPLQPLDRLTVTDGGRVVFSGLVPQGASCEEQAAQGELVSFELQSDYYVLEHTVFAKMNLTGDVVFSRTPARSKTTNLGEVVSAVRNWLGSFLPSSLLCDVASVVPTPTSSGSSPCSSLLEAGLRWVPDALVVQRYSTSGNTLRLTKPGLLGDVLTLSPATHSLQAVSLRARHDLQVPVCALIGGARGVWPAGADIRTLNAFVYAVPIDRDEDPETVRGGAGNSPASQKMVVRGVHLPDKLIWERSADEFKTSSITDSSNTAKFIQEILPEYADFIPYMGASACLVTVTPKSVLEAEAEESDDEDAKAPANYSDDPQSWSADGKAVYVHTEGSFAASSRSSRNIRGLKWCKATLAIVFSLEVANPDIPTDLFKRAQELFPGKRKSGGNWFRYVRKTISCNLINKRRKVYDSATNRLCSTDPEYSEETDTSDDTPTVADYKTAMAQYYEAASKLQHEGSITLLHDGTLNPAELTGRRVLVTGMRTEWETMNATIRSVSWDYQQQKLSLTLGTRAALGFDELLERRLIARNRGRDEAQRNALDYDPQDTEAQEAQESEMSVSPSVSASTDKQSSGRWHKPFTLYINEETDEITMAGGTLRFGTESFNVEDTEQQITAAAGNGSKWVRNKKVRLKWYKKGGALTYDIFQ